MLKYFRRRRAQLRQLSVRQKTFLVASAAHLTMVALALRVLGVARVRGALLRSTPATLKRVDVRLAQELGTLVNIAARRLPLASSCLVRSLSLEWALRRRGIACRLRIGSRIEAGTFHAHAWVECDGIPVNDRDDIASRFGVFEGPAWSGSPGT
jgi:hypothetical protein